ncbi:MAG: Omp28-related outer membrane protein, partial [Chitinophagales bacterium]
MMKKQFAVLLLLGIFCSQLVNAQSTKRYVVVEQFSNTFCPPCIFGTPEFKTNILDNYDQTDIFHVSYHVETPLPTDTFYLANPTEAADRQASYNTSGTPRMFMQGALQGFDADLLATSTLTPELGQTSPVKVSVDEIDNGDTRTATVTVSSLATPPSGAFALRVMVVERHINYDPPFTGMLPELENIFRKALNPWDATSIALPSAGSEDTYTFTYNEDLGWNADELYVLAFVQDVSTDEIINAGSTFQVEDTPTPVIAKMKVLLQGAYDAVNDIMRT